MVVIGNILWFIFGGGLIACIAWVLAGLVLALTVVGIPFSVGCFRLAAYAAFPFGQELVDARLIGENRIALTGLMNFLWILLAGLWLAIFHITTGITMFCTIIGIPFGLAHFKLAAASFAPLGKRSISSDMANAARFRNANQRLNQRLANG